MLQTLFYIPLEIAGVPVFGVGWLLAVWAVVSVALLATIACQTRRRRRAGQLRAVGGRRRRGHRLAAAGRVRARGPAHPRLRLDAAAGGRLGHGPSGVAGPARGARSRT